MTKIPKNVTFLLMQYPSSEPTGFQEASVAPTNEELAMAFTGPADGAECIYNSSGRFVKGTHAQAATSMVLSSGRLLDYAEDENPEFFTHCNNPYKTVQAWRDFFALFPDVNYAYATYCLSKDHTGWSDDKIVAASAIFKVYGDPAGELKESLADEPTLKDALRILKNQQYGGDNGTYSV